MMQLKKNGEMSFMFQIEKHWGRQLTFHVHAKNNNFFENIDSLVKKTTGDNDNKSFQDINNFTNVILATSLFFWGWAVFNTMKMTEGFDLGTVSFFLTFVSSLYLKFRLKKGLSRVISIPISLTHVSVAANYALGFYYATHQEKKLVEFAIYCAIFTLLWLVVCYRGFKLMTELIKRSETLSQGEEAMVAFLSK